jgi:hypothetical protein
MGDVGLDSAASGDSMSVPLASLVLTESNQSRSMIVQEATYPRSNGFTPRNVLTLTSLCSLSGPLECSPKTPVPHTEQN